MVAKALRTVILVSIPLALVQAPADDGNTYRPGQIVRLFYKTENGIQEIVDLPAVPERSGTGIARSYSMPDGLRANVAIRRVTEEHTKVAFQISPAKGVKSYGVALYSDPSEHFCGLMERVVDGGQRKQWQPGITEKDKQTVNVPVWARVGAIAVGSALLFFTRKKS